VSRRSPALLTVTVMLALSVGLSGCDPVWMGGGGGAPSSTSSLGTPDADGDGAAGDGSDLGGLSCPAGSWTLVNDSWASELEGLFVAGGLTGAKVRVSGSVGFDWRDDGGYVITNTASQYDISGLSDGTPYAMRVVHNGTESGTWVEGSPGVWTQSGTPDDQVVSVVSLGQSEATLTTIDQADSTPELFAGTMAVSCTASGMTTTITDDAGTVSVDWVSARG
jgi:hypothetical protein